MTGTFSTHVLGEREQYTTSAQSWRLAQGVVCLFFCLSDGIGVHDVEEQFGIVVGPFRLQDEAFTTEQRAEREMKREKHVTTTHMAKPLLGCL
jgi:hypothetical protein